MIITWGGNGSIQERPLVTLVMIVGEPVGSPPQVESEMRVDEREGSGLSPPLPNGGGGPQNPYSTLVLPRRSFPLLLVLRTT